MITFAERIDVQKSLDYYEADFAPQSDHAVIGLPAPQLFQAPSSLLGHIPTLDFRAFSELAKRTNPVDGTKLYQRFKTVRRVPFTGSVVANCRAAFELGFAPPKSISLLALLAEDFRIAPAFVRSVQSVLPIIAGMAAARVRANGADCNELTESLLAVMFFHWQSRSNDPQLHAHLYIPNATRSKQEDRWKALQFEDILSSIMHVRRAFTAHLKHELYQLGYNLRGYDEDYEIDGVSREMVQLFSSRTADVEQRIAASESSLGRKLSPSACKLEYLRSRPPKNDSTLRELHARWVEKAAASFVNLQGIRERAVQSTSQVPLSQERRTILAIENLHAAIDRLLGTSDVAHTRQLIFESALASADGRWCSADLGAAWQLIVERSLIVPFAKTGLWIRPAVLKELRGIAEMIDGRERLPRD